LPGAEVGVAQVSMDGIVKIPCDVLSYVEGCLVDIETGQRMFDALQV
jgi:hypothetical protein